MSWPSFNNGSQGSWKTKMVIGMLAFVFLMGIGYYNGRQAHPEIFDTEAVVTPNPNASAHPLSYPQIDLTEETSESADDKAQPASAEDEHNSVPDAATASSKATEKAAQTQGDKVAKAAEKKQQAQDGKAAKAAEKTP
ncbi:MAG: hypothetical protein Q4F00_04910, partial [bacterium]|nr:hypothetical protein [bacterium]